MTEHVKIESFEFQTVNSISTSKFHGMIQLPDNVMSTYCWTTSHEGRLHDAILKAKKKNETDESIVKLTDVDSNSSKIMLVSKLFLQKENDKDIIKCISCKFKITLGCRNAIKKLEKHIKENHPTDFSWNGYCNECLRSVNTSKSISILDEYHHLVHKHV